MLVQGNHFKREAVFGIIILIFLLACFFLPAGSDPNPTSYDDAIEIHNVAVPPGYEIELKKTP